MQILFLIGRLLFASLFVESGVRHLTKNRQLGSYVESNGAPAVEFITFLTGLMILVGSFLIVFDLLMSYGAPAIFLFLVPTAFVMRVFWKVKAPGMKQMQQVQFMKNISLAGSRMMIMFFTFGFC